MHRQLKWQSLHQKQYDKLVDHDEVHRYPLQANHHGLKNKHGWIQWLRRRNLELAFLPPAFYPLHRQGKDERVCRLAISHISWHHAKGHYKSQFLQIDWLKTD